MMCSSSQANHGPASIETIRHLDEYEHQLLVVVLPLKGALPGWLSLINRASAVPVPSSSSRRDSESGEAVASASGSSSPPLDQGHTTPGADGRESGSRTPDASHASSRSDVRKEQNEVNGRHGVMQKPGLTVSRGQGVDRTSGNKSLYRYGRYEKGTLEVGKALVALNRVYERWVEEQPVLCRSLLQAILQVCIDFALEDDFGVLKSMRYGDPHLGLVALKEYTKPSKSRDRLDLLLESKGIGSDETPNEEPQFGVVVVGIDFPSPREGPNTRDDSGPGLIGRLKNRNGLRQRPVDLLGEYHVSSGNTFGTARHVQSVSGLGIGYGPGRFVNHQCTQYTMDTKWHTLPEPNGKSLPWFRRLEFRVRKTLNVSREVTWRYDTDYFGDECMCGCRGDP